MIDISFLDWYGSNISSEHTHVINTVSEKGGWRTLPPDHPDLPRLVDTRHHVYFRVAPLRTFPDEGRGRKYDSGFFTAFWLDVDYNTKNAPGKTYPSPDQVQEILENLPPPNAVIYSGGGCYPLWRFTTPLPTEDPQSHKLLTDLHNAVLPHWTANGLDLDQTADMSRVLRAPGSFNTKYQDIPQVTVGYTQGVSDYDPHELLDLFTKSAQYLPQPPPELRLTHRTPYNVTEPTETVAFHELCDPGAILQSAGLEFSDRQVPPTALNFDDAIELFNPVSEEYPSRRSALLNPSGVVFFYGTVPAAIQDIVQTGQGTTLYNIANHLGLVHHVRVEEYLQAMRTRFQHILDLFMETGEIPGDYQFAQGIRDRANIARLVEAYQNKIMRADNFPVDSLPTDIRDAVKYLDKTQRIQPPASSLAYLTAVSAMCIGRFTTFRNEYPSLYGIISAYPGGGKSQLEAIVSAAATTYSDECYKAWKAHTKYLTHQEQDLIKRLNKEYDQELSERLVDVQLALERGAPPVIAENFTPAALQRMVLHPQGVFLSTAEMRRVEKYFVSDGRDNTDELLSAWSGDNVRFHRVKEGERIIGKANAAVLLMGQPDVVEGWLSDTTNLESGMLSRFLYALPTTKPEWETTIEPVDNESVTAITATILKGYHRLHPTQTQTPQRIIYTTEARALLDEWGDDYLAPIIKNREATPLHSFCAKYHIIAGRTAGVFAVYDWLASPVPPPEGPTVTAEIMANAIKVIEWYMASVLVRMRSDIDSDAITLLETCERAATNANKLGRFSATDVFRADRATFRSAKAAKAAMTRAEEQGYLDKVSAANFVISDAGRLLLGYTQS